VTEKTFRVQQKAQLILGRGPEITIYGGERLARRRIKQQNRTTQKYKKVFCKGKDR